MKKLSVIGAGSWGTAMSGLVSPRVDEVSLWAREDEIVASINEQHKNVLYLRDYQLPANVQASNSLEEVLSGAKAVIMASPSAYLRTTAAALSPYLGSKTPVLILSKGIEPTSCKLMHELVADEIGSPERIAALSGPNHAEEVSKGAISAAVIASEDPACATLFQELVGCEYFRAYTSSDIRGVETCGAVKNVIAIAAGVAAGLGAGDNTLAALMTRGVAEIGRVVSATGGDPLTCMGLAGMGDLIVTCTSRHSRNRSFGEALVAGESLSDYEKRTKMVVEGARAVQSVCEIADKSAIEVPISRVVYALLYEELSLDDALKQLMDRVPTEEFYGYQGKDES